MQQYLATFHTHLAALRTSQTLSALGVAAEMAPVPRKLSSSCGTCVRYLADSPRLEVLHVDTEGVYLLLENKSYTRIYDSGIR